MHRIQIEAEETLIPSILKQIEEEGLRYPIQVLPEFMPFASMREIVYDPADLIPALKRGIEQSPTANVAVQEAFVMEDDE